MPHKLLKEKAEERYSFHAIKLINWHNFANNSNQQPTLTDRPMAPPFVVGQMKSPKVGGMYTPVHTCYVRVRVRGAAKQYLFSHSK